MDPLRAAAELARIATEHDTCNRPAEAIYLYVLAAQRLRAGIEDLPPELVEKGDALTAKLKQYVARARELRNSMLELDCAEENQGQGGVNVGSDVRKNNSVGHEVLDDRIDELPEFLQQVGQNAANDQLSFSSAFVNSVAAGAAGKDSSTETDSADVYPTPSIASNTMTPELGRRHSMPAQDKGTNLLSSGAAPPLPSGGLPSPRRDESPGQLSTSNDEARQNSEQSPPAPGRARSSSLLAQESSGESAAGERELAGPLHLLALADEVVDARKALALYKQAAHDLASVARRIHARAENVKQEASAASARGGSGSEELRGGSVARRSRRPTGNHGATVGRKTKHSDSAAERMGVISIDLDCDPVLLHERLGGGGSGAVIYRCTIKGLTCAAKILQTETVPEVIEGVKTEINVMRTLDHPNIVKYLGHDLTHKGEIRLYIEYYTQTLSGYIKDRNQAQRPFTLSDITSASFQIIKGLEYLHAQKIVHRDMKTENIFVTLDGQGSLQYLKIGDFDSAKLMAATKKTFTLNQGTQGYMAPEMWGNVNEATKGHSFAADVWSFGIILYELMLLEPPFANVQGSAKWQNAGSVPELPEDLDPSFAPLASIFTKCCRENPAKRLSVKKVKTKLVENM